MDKATAESDYVPGIVSGMFDNRVTTIFNEYLNSDAKTSTRKRFGLIDYIDNLDFKSVYVCDIHLTRSTDPRPPLAFALSQILHHAVQADDEELFNTVSDKMEFDSAGIYELICLTGYAEKETVRIATNHPRKDKLFRQLFIDNEDVFSMLDAGQKRKILQRLSAISQETISDRLVSEAISKLRQHGIRQIILVDNLTEEDNTIISALWVNERPCRLEHIEAKLDKLSPAGIVAAFKLISQKRASSMGAIGDKTTIFKLSEVLYSRLPNKPLAAEDLIKIAVNGEDEVFKLVFADVNDAEVAKEVFKTASHAKTLTQNTASTATKLLLLDKIQTFTADEIHIAFKDAIFLGDKSFLGNSKQGLIKTAKALFGDDLKAILSRDSENEPDSPELMFLAASHGVATLTPATANIVLTTALEMLYLLNTQCGIEVKTSVTGRDPLSNLRVSISKYEPSLESSQQFSVLTRAFELAREKDLSKARADGAVESYLESMESIAEARAKTILQLAMATKEAARILGIDPSALINANPSLLALPAAPTMPTEPERGSKSPERVDRGEVIDAEIC